MSLHQECPNYSPGVKFVPTLGVTSFTWAYIGKTLEISLCLAIRHRLTKFCMWLYLLSFTKRVQKVVLGSNLALPWGVTLFTWIYIGKTLEISLYLTIRPRLAKNFACSFGPGVKFGPIPGVSNFTWTYIGKTLEISLYLAIKPWATKFCIYIVALSSRPSQRGVNYNPRVEMIAKGYKFYMGLYGEIFRNLFVAKHKNYGFQF